MTRCPRLCDVAAELQRPRPFVASRLRLPSSSLADLLNASISDFFGAGANSDAGAPVGTVHGENGRAIAAGPNGRPTLVTAVKWLRACCLCSETGSKRLIRHAWVACVFFGMTVDLVGMQPAFKSEKTGSTPVGSAIQYNFIYYIQRFNV